MAAFTFKYYFHHCTEIYSICAFVHSCENVMCIVPISFGFSGKTVPVIDKPGNVDTNT